MNDLYRVLAELSRDVKAVNVANGWWEDDRTFGDDIALLHSEASEALEAFRRWGTDDVTPDQIGEELPKPEGVGSELADVFIRLIDMCDRRGVDLAAETLRKLRFNVTRGYRHGGKRL